MRASSHRLLVAVLGIGIAPITVSASADELSCKKALNKAGTKYLVAVSKAKAAEARGRLPGRKPVPPGVTAMKIGKALDKAKAIIAAGCVGILDPSTVDPNLCPGSGNFDDCMDDFSARADAIVDELQTALLPQGPICLDDPNCLKGSLPICDEANGCFCHATIEGDVNCANTFACAAAQPCSTSLDCPSGQACYVNTCCGPPVCGPADCQPGGQPIGGGGLRSSGG